MKYLPWDRLQLSPALYSTTRVAKQSVTFRPFRTFRKKVSWSALTFGNMALFHGGDLAQRDAFLAHLADQSDRLAGSARVALFDRAGDLETLGTTLEQSAVNFEYHPYRESLFTLLGDLLTFRDGVRRRTAERGWVEAPQRPVLLVVIPLGAEDLALLRRDATARAALVSLLSESAQERLVPVLVADQAREMPNSLEGALDWAAYLGDSNGAHVTERHQDLEHSYYSLRQRLIGLVYGRGWDRLTRIHPLEFTASQWAIDKRAQYDAEDETYRRFLATLNDGTD